MKGPTTAARPAARATAAARLIAAHTRLALGVWCGLVLVSVLLVVRLRAQGFDVKLDAPPLHATPEVRATAFLVLAAGVGGALVQWLPTRAARLGWTRLLVVTFAGSALFASALALVHQGPAGLTEPLLGRYEYLDRVGAVGDAWSFVGGFADAVRAGRYSVHVQGHPPGFLLLLVGLDAIGLGGPTWATTIIVVVGSTTAPLVLVAVRNVASESTARRVAPFLVLAPAAVWIATSADALFAAVAAAATTLVILATSRRGARSDGYALAGGLLFGAVAFLSYGLVLMSLVPLFVAVARRRARPIVVAALAATAVFLAFGAAGFWWFDGLAATRARYVAGVASERGYGTFLIANLGVLAIATGPAIAVALSRLRDGRAWLLVGAALTAVAVADLSGMSKGEVERIWLPFVPWILIAGVALADDGVDPRRWLGVQVITALALEVLVRTAW
jgi:hypothetical protein